MKPLGYRYIVFFLTLFEVSCGKENSANLPAPGTVQPPGQIPGTVASPAAAPVPGTMPPAAVPPAAAPVQQIPGYVYIPPGTFMVGSAEGATPRCAGNEPAETPVTLGGFYIQQYPAPGVGQPPLSGVTWDQAKAACEAVNARLCTEVEWERACKGTDNSVYPYAGPWDPAKCAVKDKSDYMPPLGTFGGCVTEEGVHDMIGYVWEWTSGTWGIAGPNHNKPVLRGGWKGFGRTPNRCSHRYFSDHDKVSPRLGYRCCFGPVNSVGVSVPQEEGALFESVKLKDRGVEALLKDLLPRVNRGQKYKNLRTIKGNEAQTVWRPEANTTLLVSKLEYDKRDGSRGGVLLVVSVTMKDRSQSVIAVFDRPDQNGDKPNIYTRGNEETKVLDMAAAWEDKAAHKLRRLISKLTYDCGQVKVIPVKWESPGEGKVPAAVPFLKTVLDMTTQ